METLIQDRRRRPFPGRVGLTVRRVPGLGPRTVRRSRRGAGAASDAPKPAGQSHTHFTHRRGLPTQTQVSTKRGKRSRMAGFQRTRPRVPGEYSRGMYPRTSTPSQERCSRGVGWAHTANPGRGPHGQRTGV